MKVQKFLLVLLLSILTVSYSLSQSGTGEKIDRLLKKLEDSKEGPERADIIEKLSDAYRHIDPEKALNYANQGLQLSEKIKYHKGIAKSFHNIGIIYKNQGDYSRALEYYFKNLQIREDMGDKTGIAAAYNNIGIIYRIRGNYSQALEYYFKSLKIKEEMGDKPGIAASYNNIGIIYKNRGNYSKGLEYYFKNLKIKEEIGDKRGIAASYNNIGIIYRTQGNYSQALEYYFKSLKIKEEIGDKPGIAVTYNNIGIIYNIRGNYNLALEYYFKTLKFREEIRDKPGIANAYLGIGASYKASEENKKAFDYLTRGLNIAQAMDNPEIIKNAARELSEVYAQIGQYKKAYQFHVLFKEKNDSLSNEGNVKKITQLEMQYEFDKKQKQQQLGQQKKDLEKEAELRQQRSLKYTFSGVAILLALVFYTRYRLKVKVNRQLNKEIRERKQAEAELVKSMKLETVGILSAGIAHDFNNLLAIIVGNLGMAKIGLQDPDHKPVSYIEQAEKASTQATELVKKFLTISESGWIMRSKVTVTLPDVLKDTMDSSPQLREIAGTISIPKDLKPLYGDQRQLRQVMVNLLLNAHEATSEMDKDKKIEISAQNLSLSADNRWKLSKGEYVKVSVIDNGKGIPGDLLTKIFDPYFSTKQRGSQKGMGMGLALCSAIIKNHDGHISLSPRLPKGTQVDVYLPVYKKGWKNVEKRDRQENHGHGAG